MKYCYNILEGITTGKVFSFLWLVCFTINFKIKSVITISISNIILQGLLNI